MGIIKIDDEVARIPGVMDAIRNCFDSVEPISFDEVTKVRTYRVQGEGVSIHDKYVKLRIEADPGINPYVSVID